MHTSPMVQTQDNNKRALWGLLFVGIASALMYGLGIAFLPFRPDRISIFLAVFGGLFIAYLFAVWIVLRAPCVGNTTMLLTFGFGILFNIILLATEPNLSDDMFRYIWDGRVQASGINPYRYPSNAPELASLHDPDIWTRMNRLGATTIYPPGAQLVFAVWWRIVGDSVVGFKALFVACSFVCAALLTRLLKRLGEAPIRVLIFLWNPLLIFEIAHSGHVDGLYLPLIVGALLVRAASPPERVQWRYEVVIGALLGLAILAKLYPAILLPPLWSLRDAQGQRRRRLALPAAALAVTGLGYALYIAPGVDTLGFLARYTREFFNVGPLPLALINWTESIHWSWYVVVSALTPILIGTISLYFVLFPARTVRQAIRRCVYPIAIYTLLSYNLFPWYVLWLLPFVALDLRTERNLSGAGIATQTPALAWLLFTGLVVLSYTVFITAYPDQSAINTEYLPVYVLLLVAAFFHLRRRFLIHPKTRRIPC